MSINAVGTIRTLPVPVSAWRAGRARSDGTGTGRTQSSRTEIISGAVTMTVVGYSDGTSDTATGLTRYDASAASAKTRQARAYLSAANDPPPAIGSLFDLAA